jgi:hypothetical protein
MDTNSMKAPHPVASRHPSPEGISTACLRGLVFEICESGPKKKAGFGFFHFLIKTFLSWVIATKVGVLGGGG